MAKIKFTKTELKKQRDSLKQFRRFLPTLQLKKQQLQMELQKCQDAMRRIEEEENDLKLSLSTWAGFFGEPGLTEQIPKLISVKGIATEKKNIARVEIPVFQAMIDEVEEYDLFYEELWIDDAIETVSVIMEFRAKRKIIEEQVRLLGNELRVTNQRVNLFEKIKIPDCIENIRTIQIYIGDMDTAAVGRSKLAKKKTQEVMLV